MIHQEDQLSKATSSLFPIEMIAKLEWTQSNAQQNIEQLQNPTMGAESHNGSNNPQQINNNITTALEQTPSKATGGGVGGWGGGGLKCSLLVHNLYQNSTVVEAKKC